MKIVSTGKTLASEDFYRRKLQVRKKKIIFSALGILIALLAILIVLRLESFQIRDIEVVGAEVIGADRVTKEADTFLSGRYLWIIPKNSTFIYPDGSLEKFLLKSFPRFSSIDLSLSSTKRLVVSVVEREPHTLLCQNLQSDCYFLDSTGFVFDKAPFFSRGVYFTHFIEARPEEFLGKKLLGNFEDLSKFVKNFKSESIEIAEDYKLRLKSGTLIIWKKDVDLGKIYENLQAFLKNPQVNLEKLKEIDLRTPNKVFYK